MPANGKKGRLSCFVLFATVTETVTPYGQGSKTLRADSEYSKENYVIVFLAIPQINPVFSCKKVCMWNGRNFSSPRVNINYFSCHKRVLWVFLSFSVSLSLASTLQHYLSFSVLPHNFPHYTILHSRILQYIYHFSRKKCFIEWILQCCNSLYVPRNLAKCPFSITISNVFFHVQTTYKRDAIFKILNISRTKFHHP